MTSTQCTRRLDSLGRIVIPSKLRERYDIQSDKEYAFYFHQQEGKKYLCIEIGTAESEIEKAKELLEKAGYQVGSRTTA